ncbi:hypothetical protein H311_01819 [Anncaliia algerae PRA109]|nr:hypothetical protein H311_01819 [Anncaliia algerae PRA109]
MILKNLLKTLLFFTIFLSFKYKLTRNRNKHLKGTTLLLTSHPDDETMFFSPFILNNKNTFILCLSGDAERKEEMKNWSKKSNIKSFCCDLIDNTDWDENKILLLLENLFSYHKFTRIVTFDDYGVSGHKNHISCHKAVKSFVNSNNVQSLYLKSLPFYQKYGLFFSGGKYLFSCNFSQYFTSVKLMLCHRSQLKWFRVLYFIFSNYLFINVYN